MVSASVVISLKSSVSEYGPSYSPWDFLRKCMSGSLVLLLGTIPALNDTVYLDRTSTSMMRNCFRFGLH